VDFVAGRLAELPYHDRKVLRLNNVAREDRCLQRLACWWGDVFHGSALHQCHYVPASIADDLGRAAIEMLGVVGLNHLAEVVALIPLGALEGATNEGVAHQAR
jgi:hypothetical protein